MNEILYKDLKVFHLTKKSLKNSYITVKPLRTKECLDVEIFLKTPPLRQAYIQSILEEKELWIRSQITKILNANLTQARLEDEVELFGQIYSVDHPLVAPLQKMLEKIEVNDQTKVLACYDKFYKQIAMEHLTSRASYFAQKMELTYQELKFRKMKSRWGSCSSKKVITLNTMLMKVEKELIDYVVVHELAHLVHMNHSKAFHELVSVYLPQAKLHRQKLKSFSLL